MPGCPPTPEALIHGLLKLHEKVEAAEHPQSALVPQDRQRVVPVPVLGADIFDLRQVQLIQAVTLDGGGAKAASSRLRPPKRTVTPVPLSARRRQGRLRPRPRRWRSGSPPDARSSREETVKP